MILVDYLSKTIKPITLKTSVADAIELGLIESINHLVVIENQQFIGMLSTEILHDSEENTTINDIKSQLESFFLFEHSSLLDTVKFFRKYDTNLIPILNQKLEYLGYIVIDDFIAELSNFPFFMENGVILEIEIPIKNYSLNEVTKIVESNNLRLFGVLLTALDENNARITLKMEGQDLTSVIANFERFGYTIINKYFNDSKEEELIKDRYNQLMRFLEL